MLVLVKFLAKILSILNGEISPRQIAAGFAFGALMGLIPIQGLLPLFLLFIGFLININIPMMFVGTAVFKIISFFIDPLANQIGFQLLVNVAGLKDLWTTLYNAPVFPYSLYNNTIVLGSLIVGLILLFPLYWLASKGVVSYRTTFRERILKLKVVQVFKASSLYKFYLTYKGIKGD